jgi:hypothetical protein
MEYTVLKGEHPDEHLRNAPEIHLRRRPDCSLGSSGYENPPSIGRIPVTARGKTKPTRKEGVVPKRW